ncbi:hypothetical protein THTE_1752 [Thermogutta terrifontis]|uniref:Uncharacterized protein n=1 Tax=Thermogutta terrifontis TaxID=1331910 RepID=A0A286REG0_9BACT|nr:hypothetical protein THTE_1752 [Thermogutta terrifontis]
MDGGENARLYRKKVWSTEHFLRRPRGFFLYASPRKLNGRS